MNPRSVSASLFVFACLALGGLALHPHIAAPSNPTSLLSPDPRRNGNFMPDPFPPDLQGQMVDNRAWHIENGSRRRAVLLSIESQLDAFRRGDAQEAILYQRQGRYRHFPPEVFLQQIRNEYPEFGQCRAARFGPVWTDSVGQHADVQVMVRGMNGKTADGLYELVRQRGLYRVAGFRGGGWMGNRR